MTRLWVVRGGKEDEFVSTAVKTNTMALGWDEVNEDLSTFENKDSVLERLRGIYPNLSEGKLNMWANQLYRFVTDIAVGDLVVMPCNKGKIFFLGTVEGEYYFDSGSDRFKHRRRVKWKKESVSHNAFKEDLLKSFNSPGTVFEVKVNNALGRVHTILEEGLDPDFFAWIPFYKAVADALLDYRNKRNELVEGIHKIAERVPALSASSLQDKFKDGTTGPLKDICPFTTIGIFTKGQMKVDNRKTIAQELASFLGISEPVTDSFDGIPVLFATKAWFFGFEKDRQPDDIDALWEVFDQAIGFAKSQNQDSRSAFTAAYDKAIRVKGVAWNLTMGLYWIRPMSFPTLDKKSQDYIELELDTKIPNTYPDANKYLEIREKLESHFKDDKCPVHSFPNLSLAAWVYPKPIPIVPPNPVPAPTPPANVKIKNLIFYGPPGTGKTWKLNQLKKQYSEEKTLNRKTWLIQELSEASWFDVIFAALYSLGEKGKVREISEHEYVRIKAESRVREKNVKSTIWGTLQSHALEDSETVKYKDRGKYPSVFDKDESSVWSLVRNWEEECGEQIELAEKWENGPTQGSVDQRFKFVTFHQAYSYEDFIEGIRPIQDDETENIKYEVVDGVFKRICRRAEVDPSQQYAIFIDEINRGNIASIFGELITLLETDKRIIYGEDGSSASGMTLTLPYSGERFGVPANLDVYGTMNTADRSIALIDTALRRRFQFQEMMPDTSVIGGSSSSGDGLIEDSEGGTIDLRRLLETINRRIRFLLGRDMTIGHSYLINVQDFDGLKNVLYTRIIPLLQEYFYDDWHRIQLVFRDVGANGEKLEPQIIRHVEMKEEEIIGFDHADFEDSTEYSVAPEDEISPDAVRKIYEESN